VAYAENSACQAITCRKEEVPLTIVGVLKEAMLLPVLLDTVGSLTVFRGGTGITSSAVKLFIKNMINLSCPQSFITPAKLQ